MAYLEAASVQAFIRLARELEAHGAPLALQRAAERAALDEVRHARVTKALAENEGGCVPAVRAARQRHRSLEAIAIDNAVEGCVRETFGAAVAAMQAARAGDAAVRTAMGPIARDEANHASLSWRLAAWLDTKLDVDARGRVENARSRAVDDLAREIAVEPAERDRHALGLPNASTRHAVLNALRASLWS
jgi:hypothetical protein